jgi:hypothetical protein
MSPVYVHAATVTLASCAREAITRNISLLPAIRIRSDLV